MATPSSSSLLSKNETLERLNTTYKMKFRRNLPVNVTSAIERMISSAEKSPGAATTLKTFCEKNKDVVRVTSYEVPKFILPRNYTATLYDARVINSTRGRRGPDDKIYKDRPDVRRWIARGTTMMDLRGPEPSFDVVVYANKKFTGGVGDEDESQPENDYIWRQYCLRPPEQARKVVCVTKLNGEAAHFSVRYIEDEFYIFTGSKNTHMVIRDAKDINRYPEDRFSVARTVATAVCEALTKLTDDARLTLFNFLHHTKCTAVCEILNPHHQHIVALSHLKKPEINFITFTPTASNDDDDDNNNDGNVIASPLTALPPHHNLDLIKTLGLSCAPYTVIEAAAAAVVDANDLSAHRDTIRAEYNKEGEVLYYLNARGETLGMVKIKSVWYIMLRALREKAVYAFTVAKKRPNWNLSRRIASVYERYENIQNWLKLSNACLESWKNLAKAFMEWLDRMYEDGRIDGDDIRPKFPIIWYVFLRDTKSDDKISL